MDSRDEKNVILYLSNGVLVDRRSTILLISIVLVLRKVFHQNPGVNIGNERVTVPNAAITMAYLRFALD